MDRFKNKPFWSNHLPISLCFLYIISFAFQSLIKNCSIQLPEIIFIFLVGNSLVAKINFLPKKVYRFDVFVLLFVLSIIIDNLIIHSRNSLKQCVIQVYMLTAFFLFRNFFLSWKTKFITLMSRAFICMGTIASVCGITGILLHNNGMETNLVDTYYDFPYSGDTVRALGFLSSPNMLMELIGLAFMFLLADVFYKKRISIADVIVLPVLGVGAFFTFSKEIILVAVAGLILVTLHFRIKQAIKMAIGLMIVICCVGYIFFTHFIVLNTNQKSKIIDLSRSEFSSGKIIYENENFVLLESSYMALKATSFNIGKEHCWLGIGSGNYTKKLLEEKQAGNYAANLPIYDPHSTYWGIFAENGVFVLVFLFAFVFILTNQLIKHKQAFPFYDASAILALLLICWVNAISCDILNYRHLWVLLGIASGIFASKEVSKNSQ